MRPNCFSTVSGVSPSIHAAGSPCNFCALCSPPEMSLARFLSEVKNEKYARCSIHDHDIADRIVSQGQAITIERSAYAAAQRRARSARRGLWAGTFIRPDRWRERMKRSPIVVTKKRARRRLGSRRRRAIDARSATNHSSRNAPLSVDRDYLTCGESGVCNPDSYLIRIAPRTIDRGGLPRNIDQRQARGT